MIQRSPFLSVRRAKSSAKAYPYLLPLSSHEATPQHREALPCLCDWEPGAGGWEKMKSLQKTMCRPIPNGMRRKREGNRGKRADEPNHTTYTTLCAGRSPIHRDPLPLLPTLPTPPQATLRHAIPGGGGNWAATLATSQAGIISPQQGLQPCQNFLPPISLYLHH